MSRGTPNGGIAGRTWMRTVQAGMLGLAAVLAVKSALLSGEREYPNTPPPVECAFGGDCERLVLQTIQNARTNILVAMYTFTWRRVSHALVDAKQRGIEVTVKYDARVFEELPAMRHVIGFLRNRGVSCVPIHMSGDVAKMHHKFLVVDGQRVLTGSWNFSGAASRGSYENVVRIDSADVARAFTEEFERIR